MRSPGGSPDRPAAERRSTTQSEAAVAILALATGRHNHTKEHHVSSTDIELMDAFLNAPIGLGALAADMADLAHRGPATNRYAHPAKRAAPDATHARLHRSHPQDARVISERANYLADKWEQLGKGLVSRPEAACELRLALSPHPHPRRPLTQPRSTC